MVYAKIDGVVKSVKDISNTSSSDDDNSNSSRNDSAFMVITGSEGLYVSGNHQRASLGRDQARNGGNCQPWETGNTLRQRSRRSRLSGQRKFLWRWKPNVSYYQYTAYIEDSSALKNGEYVDLTIQTQSTSDTSANSIYIEKHMLERKTEDPM